MSGNESNLSDEHETLEVNATFTQYAAKMPINIAKNRYKNIVACESLQLATIRSSRSSCYFITVDDHSRVVLSQEKYTPGEDYINASFIDVRNSLLLITFCTQSPYSQGYGEKKAYIASQGPMTANFEDFWRMIWEQNIKTIVMLSKLVEDGKVHQIW